MIFCPFHLLWPAANKNITQYIHDLIGVTPNQELIGACYRLSHRIRHSSRLLDDILVAWPSINMNIWNIDARHYGSDVPWASCRPKSSTLDFMFNILFKITTRTKQHKSSAPLPHYDGNQPISTTKGQESANILHIMTSSNNVKDTYPGRRP